ncbi:hypothetical protein LC607_10795 [Nostoc sp. CHAB 5824]|nr:hypothetical protein [Nostoc sp. CHAB 5824]
MLNQSKNRRDKKSDFSHYLFGGVMVVAELLLLPYAKINSAVAQDNTGGCDLHRPIEVCTKFDPVNHKVKAEAIALESSFSNVVVVLTQCRGNGKVCGVIAANSGTGSSLATSKKNYSFGHVYKTCASYTLSNNKKGVNVCSRFRY